MQQVVAVRRLAEGFEQRRDERLAFPNGDDVGKQRQRLGVHEGDGTADHHQRIVMCALLGTGRDAGQPQHREHVGVVPLERHRERQDVEVADEGLRLERHERGARGLERRDLALRRQERPLAHDAVLGVEQTVDRLEAQVRHADEVGVGKGERHPQPPGVGLADVADLFGEQGLGLLAQLPLVHRAVDRVYLDRRARPLAFGLWPLGSEPEAGQRQEARGFNCAAEMRGRRTATRGRRRPRRRRPRRRESPWRRRPPSAAAPRLSAGG